MTGNNPNNVLGAAEAVEATEAAGAVTLAEAAEAVGLGTTGNDSKILLTVIDLLHSISHLTQYSLASMQKYSV